ncbi:MAG: hypothetical protein Q8Q09_16575 [Deltaproteobacteria bacterium]|nr:hypothetical protein [Deltaproteobacteria bacterium]
MKIDARTLRNRAGAATAELRDDESGAMMIIGLFFALFLVGALYYLLGIGASILYRERMQDAADSAAFAGAVLKARGMNLIALINIIIAALLAILIAIYASYLMLLALSIILAGTCAASAFPPLAWLAFTCALIQPAANGANALLRVYNSLRTPLTNMMKLGNKAANAVAVAAPVVAAGASALRVSTAYSPPATVGVSMGNPPVGRLPARNAPFAETCRKAKEFAQDIFAWPAEQIPVIGPVLGRVMRFLSGGFVEAAAIVVCEGGSPPDVRALASPEGSDHAGVILPRTTDASNCVDNGDGDACDRWAAWLRRSNWDERQGICRDYGLFNATLPAGSNAADCDNRVNGATRTCFDDGARRRWNFTYGLEETWEVFEGEAGVVTTRRPDSRGLSVRASDRPLCGPNGLWSTTRDIDGGQCVDTRTIVIEPAPPAPLPSRASTITEARQIARDAARIASAGSPMGVRMTFTVKYTKVRKILQCKEEPGPRPAAAVQSVSGCDKTALWVVPQSLRMGDMPFQQWGLVLGNDPQSDRFLPGVSAANRFNRSGGSDIGTVGQIASTLGRFSYAQSEFYFAGAEVGDSKEWLWHMSWTARMRRVRMPTNSGANAAAASGGGGGGFSGFSLNGIADALIIH